MRRRLLYMLAAVCLIVYACADSALALSDNQTQVFDSGSYFYDTDVDYSACGEASVLATGSGSGASTQPPSAITIKNAKIVIGIAKTDNLGKQGALIGLMTSLTESSITILGNTNVPVSLSYPGIEGTGSNGDSVGIFQQQPQYTWSTIATGPEAVSNQAAVWQLMNPAYAAEAFFGSPPGSNAPAALSKGLQNISGWQSMQSWIAAQTVQRSGTGDGSNYRQMLSKAQSLLDQYWDSSDSVPLPVPISGGISSDSSGGVASCADVSTVYGSCDTTQPLYGSVNGSGDEYSLKQLAAIFGDPGTAADHSAMENKQVTVNFLGNPVKVNPVVAPCLQAVAKQIQQSGSTYKIRSMGCYRFDSDNGTSNIGLKSYHTYGAACDINSDTNPFVESGAVTDHDMPDEYVQAFHDHGFTWGGAWHQPKDYMHFEFNGVAPSNGKAA
jgi:hypothetical protein